VSRFSVAQFVLCPCFVGVRRFEDLVAWQLSSELQQEVFSFTATTPTSRDFKFCDQIRESSRSAPSNIAEGFGRYYPQEFARFLRIAVGSLNETKNHLHDGRARGYMTDTEHERLVRLCLRALKATTSLTRYLLRAQAPHPREQRSSRRRT